jgi:flagellar biosynthesis/type III secretory pathway ATPase
MVDAAIDRRAALDTFLQQDMRETTSLEESVGGLLQALGGSPA